MSAKNARGHIRLPFLRVVCPLHFDLQHCAADFCCFLRAASAAVTFGSVP